MKGLLAVWYLLPFLSSSFSAGLGRNEENSGITYVQIKPLINKNIQQPHKPSEFSRTSRIENVPLQIKPTSIHPHSTSKSVRKTPEANRKPSPEVRGTPTTPKKAAQIVARSPELVKKPTQEVNTTPEAVKTPMLEVIRTPRSDGISKTEVKEDVTEVPEDYVDRNHESEARFDTSEAITPGTTDLEDSASTKISTTQDNDLSKPSGYNPKGETTQYNLNKYGKPKHYSKKYFGSYELLAPSYRKYIDSRHYRSNCRCSTLSNCPKLQISVPRCPVDYFMCCF